MSPSFCRSHRPLSHNILPQTVPNYSQLHWRKQYSFNPRKAAFSLTHGNRFLRSDAKNIMEMICERPRFFSWFYPALGAAWQWGIWSQLQSGPFPSQTSPLQSVSRALLSFGCAGHGAISCSYFQLLCLQWENVCCFGWEMSTTLDRWCKQITSKPNRHESGKDWWQPWLIKKECVCV